VEGRIESFELGYRMQSEMPGVMDIEKETETTRSLHGIGNPITDLKSCKLLQDTLVIWGGEFGRTPHAEGRDGRDHDVKAFTMWMAGCGVKAGTRYGVTDVHGRVVKEIIA
jgi:hypothetical protein